MPDAPFVLNIELLLKVKKHILAKPSRLHMGQWMVRAIEDKESMFNNIVKKKGRKYITKLDTTYGEPSIQILPSCGTVGCIAGWTALLASTLDRTYHYGDARTLLGLSQTQASFLFFPSNWPLTYYYKYKLAKNQRERAKIVGQVIDLFIAGGGSFEREASRT